MKRFLFVITVGSLMLIACGSHYQLSNVSRTRIIVDSKYDANLSSEAQAFLLPFTQKVDSLMGPVVGQVASSMDVFRPESKLSNLLPDIFMYMSKQYNEQPDFAVYNMGGIRASLIKGNVTYGDVLAVAPFENKICFLTLTGDKVLELFGQIAHRGGEGVSHGVQLQITNDGKLLSAKLNGETINSSALYRVTTIDYLAQGNDGLTAFKSATDLNSPSDESNNARYVIRDYFLEMKQAGKVVESNIEGRIVVVEK